VDSRITSQLPATNPPESFRSAVSSLFQSCVVSADSWAPAQRYFFFSFFTLVLGPRRFLSLTLCDKRVYEPQIRARLGNYKTLLVQRYATNQLERAAERIDSLETQVAVQSLLQGDMITCPNIA
jgi:hypothetical protein